MKIIKWIGIVLGGLVLLLVGGIFYFKAAAQTRLEKSYAVKVAPIPIPFPLSDDELKTLGEAGVDPTALAQERALARGKHYLESRAGCGECHGNDFGGKVIVENPVMGKWIAPNITRAGVTKNYRSEDWDRIIRHGVLPSGKPAVMPSTDFARFSDQEVSDIAAYIHSLPPVDREMPKSTLGPVYSLLIVNGQIPLSAAVIDHGAPHAKFPPSISAATLELGAHIGNTCKGCHGDGLSGGPIQGGDPAWPPARNLTFDSTGLARWTLDDFRRALKEGIRPDGTKLDPVMPVAASTSNLKPKEVDALYLFLQSLPKKAYGNH